MPIQFVCSIQILPMIYWMECYSLFSIRHIGIAIRFTSNTSMKCLIYYYMGRFDDMTMQVRVWRYFPGKSLPALLLKSYFSR